MIITSLLDNDLYSFTQQQAVLHHFPNTTVEYTFKCRNNINLSHLHHDVQEQIGLLGELSLSSDEIQYLRSLPYLKENYISFLKNFRLDPNYVHVNIVDTGIYHDLAITIKGNWFQTILFEVPILAIVNELYFTNLMSKVLAPEYISLNRLDEKITIAQQENFPFADFGTRRRFSKEWHSYVLTKIKNNCPSFIGTSNVHFAMTHDLKPIGTMSHQWFMVGQSIFHPRDSQKRMLEIWTEEFRGALGIALSDTLGFSYFLKDFDLSLAKQYHGCRHDSGDPFEWCEKLIAHYESLGLDPRTQYAVFSDGLDFYQAKEIYRRFKHRISVYFGIGTNLTNDCGYTPLQIVIKITKANGLPVAKLSDSPGKEMCQNKTYIPFLKEIVKV